MLLADVVFVGLCELDGCVFVLLRVKLVLVSHIHVLTRLVILNFFAFCEYLEGIANGLERESKEQSGLVSAVRYFFSQSPLFSHSTESVETNLLTVFFLCTFIRHISRKQAKTFVALHLPFFCQPLQYY